MKRTLISILCILSIFGASGQQKPEGESTEAQSPVNIGLDEVNKFFTLPVQTKGYLKSGSTHCDIVVTYVNFPEEVKVAFEYAVSIWEKCINTATPIRIHANWEELSKNELGHGKPSIFYRNFKGTPQENLFYPVALVESLTSNEFNSPNEADITCSFNKSKPWYFGTDGNTPETQYDFVTAVLHEIGHGLGISGFFISDNEVARYNNSSNSPSVYDYYLYNVNKQRIADKSLFPAPSIELTKQLTSNSVVFSYSAGNTQTPNASVYAPSIWENGISIYHLEKTNISDGLPNELMSAYAYKGEAIHNPGTQTLYILSQIGWSVNAIEAENFEILAQNEDAFQSENVNVYPNPFVGKLTFDCEKIDIQSSIDIKISDLAGSIVYRETMHDTQYNPKLSVDLSSIKPGIYVASLTDMNFKTITKRIIKN